MKLGFAIPIVGLANEAAMREHLPAPAPVRAAGDVVFVLQDAGRDPDALKIAMRINLEPGTSVDSVVDRLERFAGSGIDEAIVDAFAMSPPLTSCLTSPAR